MLAAAKAVDVPLEEIVLRLAKPHLGGGEDLALAGRGGAQPHGHSATRFF